MLSISRTIQINAPIEQVWDLVSELDRIDEWSRSVESAHYHTAPEKGVGLGRTCVVKGLGTLVEEAIEWKEGESFTLSIEGMPPFVSRAWGGWRLERIGPDMTRARTEISFETRFGPLGKLMEVLMMKPKMGKAIDVIQSEFKTYAEGQRVARTS